MFLDGPKSDMESAQVADVRILARSVDWCKTRLVERENNLGLGRSILAGMTEIFREFDRAIILEDDIVPIPGTYGYLCNALKSVLRG